MKLFFYQHFHRFAITSRFDNKSKNDVGVFQVRMIFWFMNKFHSVGTIFVFGEKKTYFIDENMAEKNLT